MLVRVTAVHYTETRLDTVGLVRLRGATFLGMSRTSSA